MKFQDEVAEANYALWEEEVRKGGGYTTPWLDLDVASIRQYIEEGAGPVFSKLNALYPTSILRGVEGKRVLCLASGGGQQSAVFGLLGARVTVVDLSDGQLKGDEAAAAHYGYEVEVIQADMRDLSRLPACAYDLVYQADSLAYVPEVRIVYAEVARVLKPHGRYRVAHQQPAVFSVAWQEDHYRITKPYSERVYRRADGGMEFRHYLNDIFNGLIALDFTIESVHEAPYYRHAEPPVRPGSWLHQQRYVAGAFAIVAKKVREQA